MEDFSDQMRRERIDQYLTGRLSAEEIEALEAELAQDNTLRQAYEDAQITQALAQDYGLREDIKSIRQAMQADTAPPVSSPAPATPSEPTKIRPLRAYLGRVAAGVAILLVGFIGFQYASLSPESLYTEQAAAYQLSVSRAPETSGSSPEEQLAQQYRANDFDAVITRYEQLTDPSVTAMFLAGQAYLQTDQPQPAIDAFRQIVAINGSQGINRFEEDAEYYLALSYLRADQVEQALPLLEAIHNDPEHSYRESITGYYLWKVRFLNRIS